MTAQELRELDAWNAKHVMGYALHPNAEDLWYQEDGSFAPFSPTEYPADAMAVLKKCAERVRRKSRFLQVWNDGPLWIVHDGRLGPKSMATEAKTLELSICLFAKNLFAPDP